MKAKTMEYAKLANGEVVHFDLDDVLDIIPSNLNNLYNIIFFDGGVLFNTKIYKKTINKFNKKKAQRGQK